MELKNSQMYNIDLKNTKEIYDFCLLNKIMDIDGFINKCFKKGFNIEKYGLIGEDSGKTLNDGEKRLINEVIRENRIEVPVEVIVEKIVEIIKEVPTPPTEVEVIKYVDREVIKEIKVEVPVEKIVYIYDKKEEEVVTKVETNCDEFLLKIQELESRKPEVVEVIKEVPVEVVKEIIIEKESTDIGLKSKLDAIQNTVQKLKLDNIEKDKKIKEYEKTI